MQVLEDHQDNYVIGDDVEVTIFKIPGNVKYRYHVVPPEFKLDEDQYELLDLARKILSEHKPKKSEFVDPENMRQVFTNVGRDLLEDLMEHKKMKLRNKKQEKFAVAVVNFI